MAMYPCLSLPSLSFPSVSGAVCSFDSQYAGLPLKSHVVQLTATQSGSGTPSPDNVRPISGWSAITITANSVPTVIQIGSTVYGSFYDAITGVFIVTHALSDMGTWTWYYNSSFNRFTTNGIQSTAKYPESSAIPNMLCEVFDIVSFDDFRNYTSVNHVLALGSTGNISARATEYGTDENAFTLAMSGKHLCYELATPQTIQLPPVRVETQLVNNIFADTGDTTLQYIKLG